MHDMKRVLEERAQINKRIRRFFDERGFLEVETPQMVASPGMEPSLSPFRVNLEEPDGTPREAGLITSPEYAMKKLLGEGLENIYTLTHVFRNREAFAKLHNPEFSMLEWYRQGMDYKACMNETEALVNAIGGLFDKRFATFERISVSELFIDIVGIDPATEDKTTLIEACRQNGLQTETDDTLSDLFFRLFIGKVESEIPDGPVFLYDYPVYQAALAQTTEDGRHGQRFELYIDGIELCNGFTELTDPDEQRQRFIKEQHQRKQMGKHVFPIDEDLLDSLPNIQNPTYGNALGVDRLHLVLSDAESLDQILPFPANTLFT